MATSPATKIGHVLAKGLGIKLDYRDPQARTDVSRGESVFSVSSADEYVEHEPTSLEWLRGLVPTPRGALRYLHNLFPFTHWITRYNVQWLYGDLVAGITVGAVVIPQSMAYAALANLPVQFGLYSSFMGVMIYWFFATSKDITIGPVAVMSTVTGNVVNVVRATNPDIPANVIASALAIIAGSIVLFLGLFRLGRIVDFIPLAAISAFMTGSAINIAAGQVPTLLGITSFSTRDSTYIVIINTLKSLRETKLDVAMGLTALAMLYLIRSACNYGARRIPNRSKTFFFISTLRTAFVILLYTMISWLVTRNVSNYKNAQFRILGPVPSGFQNAGVPRVDERIVKAFVSELPASVIVLLIEHIAISKSFGRINNYTIDPSQELVAIGVTNVLGPFLGAYPATGSFSRTAIKSKAGVRTPFAGVITGLVVLLAIYALTSVFYYIPLSSLAGVIIHAVGDLITPPNVIYQFWRISPLEVVIFFVGVFVTIFSNIENGIYATICTSIGLLMIRLLTARGQFMGKVKVHSVVGDHYLDEGKKQDFGRKGGPAAAHDPDHAARNIFLPVTHADGSNPQIQVELPYPGIFIYRFSEGFNYPNANHYLDHLVHTIFEQTRRTNPNSYPRLGDRPWNDPGPRRGHALPDHSDRPTLQAIIIDFSSVNNVDITSVQNLIDVRNQLDKYTAPETVDWHLACINNRWTKRALVSAGFGYPSPIQEATFRRWKPIFSVAEIGGNDSAAAAAERREVEQDLRRKRTADAEQARAGIGSPDPIYDAASGTSSEGYDKDLGTTKAYAHAHASVRSRVAVVQGLNRPLFHVDVTSALQSAIANVERKREGDGGGFGTFVA